MIKEKLLLYNNYSSINKNCFCCKQYTHIIEECPKLHFVPNIEKIIKKFNFPKSNTRLQFDRHRKKSNVFSFFNKKSFPAAVSKTIIEEPISPEENKSNLEILEDNNDINEINKINENVERIKEEISPFNNNFSESNKSSDFKTKVLFLQKSSQKSFNPTSSSNTERKLENNSKSEVFKEFELKNEFEIDRVCNFEKYFPEGNINTILKNLSEIVEIQQIIKKKYLKRFGKLKNYTFYLNPILEKFIKEKKKSNPSNNKKNLSVSRLSQKTADLKSPFKKKSFFHKSLEKNRGRLKFTDLINNLVAKQKNSKADDIRKPKNFS